MLYLDHLVRCYASCECKDLNTW